MLWFVLVVCILKSGCSKTKLVVVKTLIREWFYARKPCSLICFLCFMHSNLCQSYALYVLLFPGIEWKVPRLSSIKHLQSLQICISFTIFLHWFYILVANTSILVLHSFVRQSPDLREHFGFVSRQDIEYMRWKQFLFWINQVGTQLEWHDQYWLPPCGPVYISLFLSPVVVGTWTYKKPHEQHWSILHIFQLLFGTWDLHCNSLSFSYFSSLMCTQHVLLTLLHIMFAKLLKLSHGLLCLG